ncbi:hypothetical protein [Paraburkholderia sp. GAS348]|uniref:hypothetical protein n=1 Tax=Paraburkholderia sp. GAS348 TaxID=3035132 RepID=UPI003D24C284
MKGNEIIQESAALRGQGKFQEAMDLIEANLPDIDADIRLNAQLEAFRAAVEAGNVEAAREYATTIAAEEPAPLTILTVSLTNGAFMSQIRTETTVPGGHPKVNREHVVAVCPPRDCTSRTDIFRSVEGQSCDGCRTVTPIPLG